jgi:hypothetical protein
VSHNVASGIYGLTILTPIVAGREGGLRRYLRSLPLGADSPLARVPGTHFGRWLIIPQLVYEGPPQKPDSLKSQYLLFTSYFDGEEVGPYLESLAALPEAADIWGSCAGCPPAADRAAFVRYLRHNQLDTELLYIGYAASLDRVRACLALRERLREFAVDHQASDDDELLRDWRESFGTGNPAVTTQAR